MKIDPKLMEILVCPVSKQPVSLLSDDKLARLNEQISQGTVNSLDGEQIKDELSAALITENKTNSMHDHHLVK